MVNYTPVNYVLFGASAIVFSAMFIGCVILLVNEKKRWDRTKRERRRLNYFGSRTEPPRRQQQPSQEEPEAPSTVVSPTPSMTVSLRGINEWHLLPPIKENFRGYTVDSHSVGYRSTVA